MLLSFQRTRPSVLALGLAAAGPFSFGEEALDVGRYVEIVKRSHPAAAERASLEQAAEAVRRQDLARCRKLLGAPAAAKPEKDANWALAFERLFGTNPLRCPVCKTGVLVGQWNSRFTHLPIKLAVGRRKTLSPEDPLWLSVLESTGQPAKIG